LEGEQVVASIEAIEALLKGSDAWNEYQARSTGPTDLTFAELRGTNLAGRIFENCNLAGAQFIGANLDRIVVRRTIMDGADLTNVSLIGAMFEEVSAKEMSCDAATIRFVSFIQCRLTSISLTSSLVESSSFADCHLTNTRSSEAKVRDTRFDRCEVRNWQFSRGTFEKCAFRDSKLDNTYLQYCAAQGNVLSGCDITEMSIVDSQVDRNAFIGCKIVQIITTGSDVKYMDLSKSAIVHSEIAGFGPATAVLLDTAFIDCMWPPQNGTTSWLGRYYPSPHLLAHPVQDIRSIPPVLRREIADAQFLYSKLRSAGSIWSRIALRLWGFSSAYGQSTWRLTLVSLVVVVLHALVLSLIKANLVSLSWECRLLSLTPLILESIQTTASAFFGLQSDPSIEAQAASHYILLSARIFGFFALGVWVSIASTKLSKLSSE
jgi:uncharacterized protein YjbI with pentapeptide repeats